MMNENHNPQASGSDRRPVPVMPGACQRGGCGGAPIIEPIPNLADVRVNGTEITREAIAREMQHHSAPDAAAAWRAAARALAIRELLLQECQRRGIEATPELDEAGRPECDDDARVRALLDEVLSPEPPSEAECRRYYEARRERFRSPDLFEPAHILIEPKDDDPASWAAAETQAKAIIREVGNDASAFAAAARAFSACPSAQQDGSLGQIHRGDLMPSVQAALEALAEGTVKQEPVRSPYGWHVIRLHRRIPGRGLPFEAVAAKIAETLEARSWSRAATRFVAAIASQAEIEGITIDSPAGESV
jgi:peptidyl-prolyl cis-trans isomerase C